MQAVATTYHIGCHNWRPHPDLIEFFDFKTSIFTNFVSLTSGDQELVDTKALSTKHSPVIKQTSRQKWQLKWWKESPLAPRKEMPADFSQQNMEWMKRIDLKVEAFLAQKGKAKRFINA